MTACLDGMVLGTMEACEGNLAAAVVAQVILALSRVGHLMPTSVLLIHRTDDCDITLIKFVGPR